MIMAKISVCVVLFLLSILGLTAAVRALSGAVLGQKRKRLLSVVFLDGVDTEFVLRCALGVHSSCPVKGSDRIYAVDCGMNPENRKIAGNIAKKHSCLTIVGMDEFIRMGQELDFPEYRIKAE